MRNGAANPFGDVSRRFFDLCTTMGHVVLATLARGLQVPEEHLVERMVDAPDTPLSSTIFRFFHYYATHGAVPACHIHTDIGLITLIPATNWPSLEVMDFERFDWYNFERPLQPHDMMVLCGETLERLSAYYYRAVVHRVAPTVNERISLVYLMRARPDAVLDSVALQSPVLGEIYEDCREPLLVAKFMRHKVSLCAQVFFVGLTIVFRSTSPRRAQTLWILAKDCRWPICAAKCRRNQSWISGCARVEKATTELLVPASVVALRGCCVHVLVGPRKFVLFQTLGLCLHDGLRER